MSNFWYNSNKRPSKKKYPKTEQRIIYEKEVGEVPRGWHVHRIDFSKTNNDIKNLIAIPRKLFEYASRIRMQEGIIPSREYLENQLKNFTWT